MTIRNIFLLLLFLLHLVPSFGQPPHPYTSAAYRSTEKFDQEYHEPYPIGIKEADNTIRAIAVDKNSTVFVAGKTGIYRKNASETTWVRIRFNASDEGPAYAVAVDNKGTVWLGTWNGCYQYQEGIPQKQKDVPGPVSVLCVSNEGVYALGPMGSWLCTGGKSISKNYAIARSVRAAVSDGHQGLWVGTDVGLYHVGSEHIRHFYKTDMLISASLKGLALNQDGSLWAAGLGGVSILKNEKPARKIRPSEGCPSIFANCIKRSPDGTIWVGTRVGVVRFSKNGSHSLLFSRRWLLDDEVNAIDFDPEGNAWVATAQGVSAIKKKRMSLADKQDYFYDVLMRRHIREPWISGQCHLLNAGDTSRWIPEDDDNDGEYTGNYLAMESFRYAVTKSEDARSKAAKAFHFLKLLQDITGGDGFFARTIVPVAWAERVHDPNREYTETEKAEELVSEPRAKPVTIRWHKSADGKWFWKGDASSDEWCGHMMGYYFYYQLAATEEERSIVREHVASLADHLIAHHFMMMDFDGTHTRWAVWSPLSLNHDPEWFPDRSQNSLELLAFIKLAYYMTGNQKYEDQYRHLINEEHYLDNLAAIPDQNPAWFIYFDATMQAYLYPILLQCEKDPRLHAFYQVQIDKWMAKRKADQNPLVNFLYCYARNKKIEAKASFDFLKDTPLDLIDWNIDHTKREDIRIVHTPVLDDLQVSELPPASIRGTVRWDKNPWGAICGAPETEREPVFWLYPYWMGRYLNMIK